MKNSCELKKMSDDTFDIVKGQTQIGKASFVFGEKDVFLQLEILPEYQCAGYGSCALEMLTTYGHEQLLVPYIHMYVPVTCDRMRHMVEHHGYERMAENVDTYLYVHHIQETISDDLYPVPQGCHVLYLAGGCFWGLEKAFRMLEGVRDTTVGYANSKLSHPTYEQVCHNETNAKETVRVTFDQAMINDVLEAYFICIDPTRNDGQGNDIGSQYLTGVYYKDESLKPLLESYFLKEKQKYDRFYVELARLQSFWIAEEYHQNYLTKIPNGYCHIHTEEIEKIRQIQKR